MTVKKQWPKKAKHSSVTENSSLWDRIVYFCYYQYRVLRIFYYRRFLPWLKKWTSQIKNYLNNHLKNRYPFTFKKETFLPANLKNSLKSKIKQSSPMAIMLVSVAIVFGGIFAFLLIKSYFVNQYLKSMGNPPVTVSTVVAGYQAWQPRYKVSGSLQAVYGVDVTTEIAGLVRERPFVAGTTVKMGDLLVQLNIDEEKAQLLVLEAAAELAKITYQRDKEQYAINAISKAEFDTAVADLKSKNAQVEQQKAIIAKKTIRAPFSGRLGISYVNLGQYVNPGDKIVTLQALDTLYANFYIPQQMLKKISKGQTVRISSDAANRIFEGKITAITPKVDNVSRNAEVEATFQNPDYKLLPGMFVQTEIEIGKPEKYITLPQTAISYNPYGELIYIVNESKKDKKGKSILTVTQHFVTVGDKRGDQAAILKGLNAGETVVSSGQNKLRNGSTVIINNKVEPLNNPSPHIQNE